MKSAQITATAKEQGFNLGDTLRESEENIKNNKSGLSAENFVVRELQSHSGAAAEIRHSCVSVFLRGSCLVIKK